MGNFVMTRAPVRVSFFGGGTDYPEYFRTQGGAVLATAIDKFSYVTASAFLSRLFDYKVRVSYRQVELVKNVGEIQHRVFRACLEFCGLEKDVELHNVADLPAFSGLGSSSAFTVALLQALHAFKGEAVKGIQLAYEAIHIERWVLKDNVGCQDQTTAAVGGFNLIEFRSEDDIAVHRVPVSPARIEELEAHLLVIFTQITRKASDVVANQLKRVGENYDTLKKMRHMVDRGWHILTGAGSLISFGELLNEAWQAKQSLAQDVSNDKINAMYRLARENGAVGGKLLGAGGGGFLLLFVPPENREQIRRVFSNDQEIEVRLNAPGAEIIF
jgi:D-glycero-alpha-D-manno-heptose-7-phosphate kinase